MSLKKNIISTKQENFVIKFKVVNIVTVVTYKHFCFIPELLTFWHLQVKTFQFYSC